MATSTVDIVRKLDMSTPAQFGQCIADAELVDASATDWLPKASAGNKGALFDGLYFGGAAAANISVTTLSGHTVVFKNVQPGTFLPIIGSKVTTAGTTAAANDIVAVYG